MIVNLQILNNEASTKFKHLITEELGINNQLVPRKSTDIMLQNGIFEPSGRTIYLS